jgi:hypothetical protein
MIIFTELTELHFCVEHFLTFALFRNVSIPSIEGIETQGGLASVHDGEILEEVQHVGGRSCEAIQLEYGMRASDATAVPVHEACGLQNIRGH